MSLIERLRICLTIFLEIELKMIKQFIFMNDILGKLELSGNWKELMRSSCKNNGLKTSLSNELTLLKVRSLSNRFNRSYQSLKQKVASVWIQNQLKAYHWLLVALSAIDNLKISLFGQEQWSILESIFQFKSRSFLKYEAKRLTINKIKNKSWTQEENKLLKAIIEKSDTNHLQWNDIARTMFQLSNETVFRTGKQCRERWLNYLDPSKQRGEWTVEEDYLLVSKVQENGKKWSEYGQEMRRTEHTVKNRFNSLIIRQKRMTPHIHKEQKLIELIKKHLKNRDSEEEIFNQSSQGQSFNEVQLSVKQLQKSQIKEQKIVQKIPVPSQRSRINTSEIVEEIHEKKPEEEDQRQISGIMRFVRDDTEIKNPPQLNQFNQLYSPFWTYSPSNGTPNAFMNSPSPLSFYINYSFTSCFHRFTGEMPSNFTSGQHPSEENR